jgi:hypothetical protein
MQVCLFVCEFESEVPAPHGFPGPQFVSSYELSTQYITNPLTMPPDNAGVFWFLSGWWGLGSGLTSPLYIMIMLKNRLSAGFSRRTRMRRHQECEDKCLPRHPTIDCLHTCAPQVRRQVRMLKKCAQTTGVREQMLVASPEDRLSAHLRTPRAQTFVPRAQMC